MVKPRGRRTSPVFLTHYSREQSPRPLSAFEEFCDFEVCNSRPVSGAYSSDTSSPRYTMTSRAPTLTEILLDTSSPPWTLSAFMAYLSQNHCMETLEFTLDSQRYTTYYGELIADDPSSHEENERVCAWWEKLMQVYIVPCAPREVNIPARVRDNLLNLPYGPSPPHPSQLNEAGRIVYELMNDSLLLPFLQSVAPVHHIDSSASDSLRSPRVHAFVADSEGLTDDSDGNSPQAMEPMTPPTTPPTTDWNFTTSPGGFQRAVAAHSKGWKKMGAKLGFTRKGSSRRSNLTSSATERDTSVDDTRRSSSSNMP